jgi:hypothetical protein
VRSTRKEPAFGAEWYVLNGVGHKVEEHGS